MCSKKEKEITFKNYLSMSTCKKKEERGQFNAMIIKQNVITVKIPRDRPCKDVKPLPVE